jgi:hypothetical protein
VLMGCLGCVECFLVTDTAQVELRSGQSVIPWLPAAASAAARMHHTAKRILDSEFPPTVGAPQFMLAASSNAN